MKSLRYLYKIGRGPSSSHTIGPEKACKIFLKRYPQADEYEATLLGSLSATGKGHLTDEVIRETFAPGKVTVIFGDTDESKLLHPNTLILKAKSGGSVLGESEVH